MNLFAMEYPSFLGMVIAWLTLHLLDGWAVYRTSLCKDRYLLRNFVLSLTLLAIAAAWPEATIFALFQNFLPIATFLLLGAAVAASVSVFARILYFFLILRTSKSRYLAKILKLASAIIAFLSAIYLLKLLPSPTFYRDFLSPLLPLFGLVLLEIPLYLLRQLALTPFMRAQCRFCKKETSFQINGDSVIKCTNCGRRYLRRKSSYALIAEIGTVLYIPWLLRRSLSKALYNVLARIAKALANNLSPPPRSRAVHLAQIINRPLQKPRTVIEVKENGADKIVTLGAEDTETLSR